MSAPNPAATPDDVTDLIETDLDHDEIAAYIEFAADDNREVNEVAVMDEYRQKRIEALLAAIKIKGYRDRSVSSGGTANSSVSFEGNSIRELKSELNRIDPSGSLAGEVLRDGNRHITTTSE